MSEGLENRTQFPFSILFTFWDTSKYVFRGIGMVGWEVGVAGGGGVEDDWG
jgi:hypothetical protein